MARAYHKASVWAPDGDVLYRVFTYIKDRLHPGADFVQLSQKNVPVEVGSGQPSIQRVFGAAVKNSNNDPKGVLAASFELALRGIVMTLRDEGYSVQVAGERNARDNKQVEQTITITHAQPARLHEARCDTVA